MTAQVSLARTLIGQSPKMEVIRRLILKAARSRLPVLLLGESGTGKEVVARAIYDQSPRGQFVPIDCGSLVGTLMESELFGHAKGSFSGAVEKKKGLVEMADGGTAFFDEIGDLPLEMQVKLLRLLQESQFRAVGSLNWQHIDLRVIAATHRDLTRAVAEQRFRQDLFYRLNVLVIHVPPLRDRKEDVPLLVAHFLRTLGWSAGINHETMDKMMAYDWPGNVRELKNCIERMVATNSGGVLLPADLPSALQYHGAASNTARLAEAIDEGAMDDDAVSDLPEIHVSPRQPVVSIKESERQTICNALAANTGDRGRTARALGIGRTTLYRKMKTYGIS
jgi:DNA-binding NtrC family response regulator